MGTFKMTDRYFTKEEILDIEALRVKLDNYFAKTSAKQLKKDLIKAGLKVYVGDEYNFLDEMTTDRYLTKEKS